MSGTGGRAMVLGMSGTDVGETVGYGGTRLRGTDVGYGGTRQTTRDTPSRAVCTWYTRRTHSETQQDRGRDREAQRETQRHRDTQRHARTETDTGAGAADVSGRVSVTGRDGLGRRRDAFGRSAGT
eukprot:672700-Rhodomonas_salina.2